MQEITVKLLDKILYMWQRYAVPYTGTIFKIKQESSMNNDDNGPQMAFNFTKEEYKTFVELYKRRVFQCYDILKETPTQDLKIEDLQPPSQGEFVVEIAQAGLERLADEAGILQQSLPGLETTTFKRKTLK